MHLKPAEVIIASPASLGLQVSQSGSSTEHSNPIPYINGIGEYRWIIHNEGLSIYVPSNTDKHNSTSRGRGSRKYRRQGTITFKSGPFAENEEFKRTIYNMNKILDRDDGQFGRDVFLSLRGKAAECLNNMPIKDICDVEKLFDRLGKTFLPRNYCRAVLWEFHSMKFKVGNKLTEFYEDLKVAYRKARPDTLNSDNYVKVDRESSETALSFLKCTSDTPEGSVHKVSFDAQSVIFRTTKDQTTMIKKTVNNRSRYRNTNWNQRSNRN